MDGLTEGWTPPVIEERCAIVQVLERIKDLELRVKTAEAFLDSTHNPEIRTLQEMKAEGRNIEERWETARSLLQSDFVTFPAFHNGALRADIDRYKREIKRTEAFHSELMRKYPVVAKDIVKFTMERLARKPRWGTE